MASISFAWGKKLLSTSTPAPPPFFLSLWYTVFLVTCVHNKVQMSNHSNLFWQALANQVYAI